MNDILLFNLNEVIANGLYLKKALVKLDKKTPGSLLWSTKPCSKPGCFG